MLDQEYAFLVMVVVTLMMVVVMVVDLVLHF
jgi:hypothetical protein